MKYTESQLPCKNKNIKTRKISYSLQKCKNKNI